MEQVRQPKGSGRRFLRPLARAVLDVADRGLQRERMTPDVLRRVRLIHFATLALCIIGVPYTVQYWSVGLWPLSCAILLTMLAGIGNLFLLRRTMRPILCSHLILSVLHADLILSIAASGGFYDPNFSWFYVVPMAAAVVLDLRGAWIWAGVTIATTFGFWLLPHFGVHLHSLVPEDRYAVQSLFNRVSAVLALSFVASAFVLGQRRAERDLEVANASLSREQRYTELLRHAATSANEAVSLDEAMRESVRHICRSMGWPVGHFYWRDEDGALVTSGILYSEHEGAIAPVWQVTRQSCFRAGEGLPGRALAAHRPEVVWDTRAQGTARAALAAEAGFGAAFAVPVVADGEVPAVLEMCASQPMEPDGQLVEILAHVGQQLGRVVIRAGLQEQLRQSQKLEAVGKLAAGLAHEINNPMAYVKTNLNLLRNEWAELRKQLEDCGQTAGLDVGLRDCEELIDESLEGVERTIEIVRDVRDFSRSTGGERHPSDLNEILEGAFRVAATQAPQGVRFERAYGKLPSVRCAPGQVRQVFVNLIVNAVQAVGEEGCIRLTTRRDGSWVLARVEDDGPGVAEAHRARLFDPFFTTKPVGEGTGLGLYVSYQIAAAHGGEIRMDSSPAGSCFEVRLPLDPPTLT